MGRDKARDDKYFNCQEDHEIQYVANQYGADSERVADFLKRMCEANIIHNSTHDEVYALIEKGLKLARK